MTENTSAAISGTSSGDVGTNPGVYAPPVDGGGWLDTSMATRRTSSGGIGTKPDALPVDEGGWLYFGFFFFHSNTETLFALLRACCSAVNGGEGSVVTD